MGVCNKRWYANALRAYQVYLSEIKKSDDRDKAAAFDNMYKYYEWYNTDLRFVGYERATY